MATHRYRLDLNKDAGGAPQGTLVAHVGDSGEVVEVELTRDGQDADLSGCPVDFLAAKPDRSYCEQPMQVSGSTASVTIDPRVFGMPGMMRVAYVRVTKAGKAETTPDILISVLPSADGTGVESGPFYSALEKLMATMRQQISEAASAAEEARSGEQARRSAEAGRVQAEAERAVAEQERASAETSRADAEASRASAEGRRASAESGRAQAESERSRAEAARSEAERSRSQAEQGRAQAESLRASAETARAAAETARAAEFADAQRNRELAFNTAEEEREAAGKARAAAFATSQAQRQSAFEQAEAKRDSQAQQAASTAFTAAETAVARGGYAKEQGDRVAAFLESGVTPDNLSDDTKDWIAGLATTGSDPATDDEAQAAFEDIIAPVLRSASEGVRASDRDADSAFEDIIMPAIAGWK